MDNQQPTNSDKGNDKPVSLGPLDMDKTLNMPQVQSTPSGFSEDQLASELKKRGVPTDEIARMISTDDASMISGNSVAPIIPRPVTLEDLHPSIQFPEFRESSQDEKERADKLLTRALLEKRRERLEEAEKLCWQALQLIPNDPGVLELYGDIMQEQGRVDDAIACYARGKMIQPHPASVENKYAELLLMQNQSDINMNLQAPRNPWIALCLSFFPGAGQLYNGEYLKGALLLLISFVMLLLLGWSPFGFPGLSGEITTSFVVLMSISVIVFIYAMIDALLTAQKTRSKSGWEV